jgi:hypothetical protein
VHLASLVARAAFSLQRLEQFPTATGVASDLQHHPAQVTALPHIQLSEATISLEPPTNHPVLKSEELV